MDIVDGCYSWYNDPACGTRSENNWVKNIGSALGHNDVNDVLQRGGVGWLLGITSVNLHGDYNQVINASAWSDKIH